ncbi:hypothetical protein HPB47_020078 [Ixodes persulcatus]|uniref:Uncharacterized protein n=1 Tax=Ixodes persulcatus TaxID=34615 RepID=A0AC60QIQ5_IXOPE|nr:hypothetical protein HPB47_020078 [Ixodes persulcatus]
MEKVANSVFFPCKYSSTGCPALLSHSEKPEHEETCEFRRALRVSVPWGFLQVAGILTKVMAHLVHSHKSITTLHPIGDNRPTRSSLAVRQTDRGLLCPGEDIVFLATDINLPGAVDWVMMQSCFGHHFMLVLEKQEKYDGHQQFFAVVQLIGSRKQADNFIYRLELNGLKRRLTWEATPRSIHEGVQAAIMSSDCLVFDTSIAQLFADSGNLGINVTISLS